MAKKQYNKSELKDLGALWKATSKGGMNYFTGKTATGERLVAFVNKSKKNGNEPDIRIYFQVDEENADDEFNPF